MKPTNKTRRQTKQRQRRVVCLKVLPGQPTDGSGKVCIHLFVRDQKGIITEPHVLLMDEQGQQSFGAARGRLACDPKRRVAPTVVNGITTVTVRSDDPRAVNCPRCIASKDYVQMMALLQPQQSHTTQEES